MDLELSKTVFESFLGPLVQELEQFFVNATKKKAVFFTFFLCYDGFLTFSPTWGGKSTHMKSYWDVANCLTFPKMVLFFL